MSLQVPTTNDLVGVLDRVLDKGISFHPLVRITFRGIQLVTVDGRLSVANVTVETGAVYVGYASHGDWMELDREDLFPYWLRNL